MHKFIGKVLSVCVASVMVFARPAIGQVEGGVITGSVHDASGAAVPGVEIDVSNLATGEHLEVTSNNNGDFTTPTLRVGTYEITASHADFKKTVQSNVILELGTRPAVNLILQVGGTSESVQVSAAQPAMNTTTTDVSTVIESRPVSELPLNGRNAVALALTTPGVHSAAGTNQSGFADRGTLLTALVINNGPNSSNGILLDGANNLSEYTEELSVNPAVDAIQEFSVLSGVISAKYGFTGGGIINMATKSGTNKLSGSLYEYLRNDAFDARDYFLSPTASKPELRYNQYGAAVGGPIRRDRAFFFTNFEEFRYRAATVAIGTVPTLLQRKGDFSQTLGTNGKLIPIYDPSTTTPNPNGSGYVRSVFTGNVIPADRLDPVALAVQNSIYPEPNIAPSNAITQSNNFQGIIPNIRSMRQAMGRVDDRVSDRHSVFARYAYFNHVTDNGGAIGSYLVAPQIAYRHDSLVNQSGILGDTYVFSPSLVNEFRLAVTRTDYPFAVASHGGNWPQKLGFPSIVPPDVFPTFNGNGLPQANGTVGFRAATNPQILDTVSLVRGAHALQFGGEWRLRIGANTQSNTPSGLFSFSSLLTGNPQSQSGTGNSYASFLLGQVASSSIVLAQPTGVSDFTLSGFAEDNWKVTNRVTLNLGLRYDFQGEPVERHNGYSNFNPYIVSSASGLLGAMQYAGVDGAPRSFDKNDYRDWGPRVGFAWDAFGDGHTSVRGGYGIYYVSIFNNYISFDSTAGFAQTTTSYTPPGNNTNFATNQLSTGFPSPPIQPVGAKLGPDGFLGSSVTYQSPEGATPMSRQVNLAVQRELPWSLVIEAAYLQNHGTHMVSGGYNLNQLDPKYLSLGTQLQSAVPNPYAGKVPGSLGASTITLQQSLLPFPYYSAITAYFPRDGVFHGDSFELSVIRHASSGLNLLANYTISKLLDSGIVSPVNYNGVYQATVLTPQNSYNRRAEYSIDPLNVSQRASISMLYDLPFGRGKRYVANVNGFVSSVIGGWQVNAVSVLQKGLPLTISGANNNAATRPNFVAGVSPKLAHGSIKKWFNTAALVNPPQYTYGNVPRALSNIRGPAYLDLDLSAFKTTRISENVALQFRIEAFNALNHPNFLLPNMTFSPGSDGLNASGTFGSITSDINPRNVQLALRLLF